jgi:hypothetical protein
LGLAVKWRYKKGTHQCQAEGEEAALSDHGCWDDSYDRLDGSAGRFLRQAFLAFGDLSGKFGRDGDFFPGRVLGALPKGFHCI